MASVLIACAEKELCRVQAIKSLNNGRLGNALDWALRSQDNLHVTSIADLLLKVCMAPNNLQHTALHRSDIFSTNIVVSTRYIELYKNGHRSLRRRNHEYRR